MQSIKMSKQERDDVAAMVRGMTLLPKTIGLLILTPIMAGVFFAVYAIVSALGGEGFSEFTSGSIFLSLIVFLGISLLGRHYLDRLTLKITGQYNEATLARGRLKVDLKLKDRVKQFIPTLLSWKWLLLLWVVANAFDCISTYLALNYGAQEANPAARDAANMYASKWVGVAILTVMMCFFQWRNTLKLVTTVMLLVALSNFAVLGIYLVQPNLAGIEYPETETAAFLIQLAETAVVAVVILWGRDIWGKLGLFYSKYTRGKQT